MCPLAYAPVDRCDATLAAGAVALARPTPIGDCSGAVARQATAGAHAAIAVDPCAVDRLGAVRRAVGLGKHAESIEDWSVPGAATVQST